MLTREFKETVQKRAQQDVKFRRALLLEAINEFLAGDTLTAKAMLRDYINATVTFDEVAHEMHKNTKSIQRMLGPNGNPTMDSLASMLHILQKKEEVTLTTSVEDKEGRS